MVFTTFERIGNQIPLILAIISGLIGIRMSTSFADTLSDSLSIETQTKEFTTVDSVVPKKTALPFQTVLDTTLRLEAQKAVVLPAGVLFGQFAKEDGPFLLSGSVIVPSGQILEFGPGSHIYIGGKYTTITVFGQIVMKGTAKEPVVIESARFHPKPWDWDRIYCRSRIRSQFEHCIIRHSNYGIYAENSCLYMKGTVCENNSLHGLVLRNSDAIISKCIFTKGHVLAILCQEGSNATFDSCVVRDNTTGIAVDSLSTLVMEKGTIDQNTIGVALRKRVSVSIIGSEITANKTGLVSDKEISKAMRIMVYKNAVDFLILSDKELNNLFKPPVVVKSLALPKTQPTAIQFNASQAGFSALAIAKEKMNSFIGTITSGLRVSIPTSFNHPKDTDPVTGLPLLVKQTKYLGEHENGVISKLQPELLIFLQANRSATNVTVNADLYGNDWIDVNNHIRASQFTVAMTRDNHSATIGDFYENLSEISMSSRKLRGVKYSGDFVPIGRGEYRFNVHMAAGQSETQKKVGSRELDLFGDTVKVGGGVRQQMTYVYCATVNPIPLMSASGRLLISRDQYAHTLFTESLVDALAPKPIESQSASIETAFDLFDNQMQLDFEFGVGSHDTVTVHEYKNITWYNPQLSQSLSRISTLINTDSSNYAYSTSFKALVKGYDLSGSFVTLGKRFFSAGNPYLQPDRNLFSLMNQKQITEKVTLQTGYDYERLAASYDFSITNESPSDYNTIQMSASYTQGPAAPSFGSTYALKLQTKDDLGSLDSIVQDTINDTTISLKQLTIYRKYGYRKLDHNVTFEAKQQLDNGVDYNLQYGLIRRDDFSKYPTVLDKDHDDGWEHILTGKFGCTPYQWLRARFSARIKARSAIANDLTRYEVKVSHDDRFNLIPRKLTTTAKIEYQWQKQSQTSSTDNPTKQTVRGTILVFELGTKYMINSRLSFQGLGKFEKSYDETSNSSDNYRVFIVGCHGTYLF